MDATKLIICTPVDGNPHTATVSYSYHNAVRQLERAGAVVIPSEVCFSDDLSRARSRAVWYALQKPDWSWLLFWDEDVVVPDVTIIPRMLERAVFDGHDMIAAPYPRKRSPIDFPYKPLPASLESGRMEVKNDCVEVDLVAAGFLLVSRECLETMCDAYSNDWFTDAHDASNVHETVALFKQVHTDETKIADGKGGSMRFRELYSEDYSFCWRWRKIGGKIQMYTGPGAPLGHVGGFVYTGTGAELGQVG